MKYLVIYDSVFGNTEKIARAVDAALAKNAQGSVVRVSEASAEQLAGLDLILVGSPTRAFQPTPAMKDFIKKIPASALKGVPAAVFDTRIDIKTVNNLMLTIMTGIFGYAAGTLAKMLAGKGARVLQPAGGFIVTASEGPLKNGELEKAADWAGVMASSL